MIEVKNLYKSFGDKEVLKGISATFEKGKTNMIIGRSGSGKTVFLKSILGLIQPNSGHIYFDGRELNQLSINEQRKLRMEMGVVFQGNALFDSFTIEENIMFPMKMFTEMSKAEMENRVDEVLEQVELSGINDKYPSEISGGMQKRVGIARAIVLNPKYLFCDEPNSGLDPKTAILIDNLIHDLTVKYDTTTLINTHDMNSIMEIGEKIILLKDGHKQWEGNKIDVFHTQNEDLNDFVFSSSLFKKIKNIVQKEGKFEL